MKRALTIGLAAAALTATLSWVAAEPVIRDRGAGALPAFEILAGARALGFNPIGDPVRRGPYYLMHAYDPRGIEVRVVADALSGDLLSAVPLGALATTHTPSYERGPRIIHVPPRGERANVRDNVDEPELTGEHDNEVAAPPKPPRRASKPPARTVTARPKPAPNSSQNPSQSPSQSSSSNPSPRAKRHSDAPPPPPPPPPTGPRRAVLSAPPPAPIGPTVQPTPPVRSAD